MSRAPKPCKHCGAPGVPKGRTYHRECRAQIMQPVAPKACIDCGSVRRVWLGRNAQRCKACALKRRGGSLNGRWRGGITDANKAARQSPAYKAWRRSVFERDGYRCVACGVVGGALNADHIKPFALYPELRLDVSNGRTLCVECHMLTPTFLGGTRKLMRQEQKRVTELTSKQLNLPWISPSARPSAER